MSEESGKNNEIVNHFEASSSLKKNEVSELNMIIKDLTAGTIGGCMGIIAGQPFDTIKVRIQSAEMNYYRNTFHCLTKTISEEGFFSLYKGMVSPLVGNAPINAIVFGAYGNAMRLLMSYKYFNHNKKQL